MSSTILHATRVSPDGAPLRRRRRAEAKNPFLVALGERVRALRARRGMTRKALALAADVSERHLANLEYGIGNASILVLLQVAQALQCSLAELIGDVTTSRPSGC
jgi:XRE family transcriptional regulator, aerobic/anaerobic benzoate catabolism transcriptional regulator